jgi:hypothetical protein
MLYDHGNGRSAARSVIMPLINRSHKWCAAYTVDRLLASDDIIDTLLRCRSRLALFAPLQSQSILHASVQKIGRSVDCTPEDILDCVSVYP